MLVVDEDPIIRVAIDRQLEMLGWQAICVNNGMEAVHAAELGVTVDVLLTDLQPGGLHGTTVASAVARYVPDLRVVFMGQAASPAPDVHVLVKPFSTRRLAEALAAAVRLR